MEKNSISALPAEEMPNSIYGIVDHINEQIKMLFEKADFIDNKNRMLSGRESDKELKKGLSDRSGLVGRTQDILNSLQALNTRLDFAFRELEGHLG